ncbi:MAG TPA: cupin domain-containing protein [Dehalococcoidia bacterium]|nr:cupin domain-containing protein [Dehalococcoidia bacterium]
MLVFANPGLEGRGAATTTLMANLQIINPGEIARTHRHTPSAFRLLIVEGTGAYTTVEGEKTYMDPGDFITTPNWTWHDHGNEGIAPMVWLDGLDVPLVNYLEAGFYNQY